ncbi:peroxiredoxin [Sansalvadorimonas sp. 2012CJ34-2]|uniref:Glutathione-dependent peroxiredoxin n=1 Tax=Parendozoicomonas callyspongiae TaxID=2942213 RepID=A0ABT0PDD0_9GAMM|nr:peroxiredoxin [Sansalvadorimonas sp. 2012CJ34-2]MCL6269388.1 peroxiredoxin [Sansalvadorimonas sp. 2012CJ34-2]
MSIQAGNQLPDFSLFEYDDQEGVVEKRLSDLAWKKKVIVVGVPGAYTPVCSGDHLPSYIQHYQDFIDLGIDEIWCIAVNDVFVLNAWAKEIGTEGSIRMLSDGSAEFVRAMNVALDLTSRGMGVRSDRYAMVVDNGVVTEFLREEPGQFQTTDAATLLNRLTKER